jgi:hypothetical protein
MYCRIFVEGFIQNFFFHFLLFWVHTRRWGWSLGWRKGGGGGVRGGVVALCSSKTMYIVTPNRSGLVNFKGYTHGTQSSGK